MKTKQVKQFLVKAKKINRGKNTLEILDNILYHNGSLHVSNLEVTLIHNIEATAQPGRFLIPLIFLDKIITKVKTENVDLSTPGEIRTDKGNFKYTAPAPDGFPDLTENNFSPVGSLDLNSIQEIKNAAIYASTDELRPVMTGVYITEKDIVCTDAHKMYFTNNTGALNNQSSFIMPRPAIDTLNVDMYEVYNSKIDNHGFDTHLYKFQNDGEIIIFREIDGKYPNWSAVVPTENQTQIRLDKKELLEALNLSLLACNPTTKQAVFNFDATGALQIRAKDKEQKTEYNTTMQTAHTGPGLVIGFNAGFLIESLKFAQDQPIIEMSLPNRAAIIDGKILLMPVMLEKETI